jgi:hypothetical protein
MFLTVIVELIARSRHIGCTNQSAIPEAAEYVKQQWVGIIENHGIDLYRHDNNGGHFGLDTPESSSTMRDGFMESDYWRLYEAWYGMVEEIQRSYPDLIMHQASGGGFRLDLGGIANWHEQFVTDEGSFPRMFQIVAGASVYLPPAIQVFPSGLARPYETPELETILRGAYCLANTPFVVSDIIPLTMDQLSPQRKAMFLRYANLYKSYMRPLLPTIKTYHHEPVNATGGVTSSNWFAMEYMAADASKGWATIVRLGETELPVYLFRPRGLSADRMYQVTFDNSKRKRIYRGEELMRDGLTIPLEGLFESELLLIEGQ